MKKTASVMVCAAMAIFLLTGCQGKEAGKQGAAPEKQSVETGTTREDMVIIIPNDFTTLDPQKLPSYAEISFCGNIFDPLVTTNENQEAEPCLAESWEASDDKMSYTFHLRQGVKFHNGEELKANDVVYTVKRYVEEEWMSPYSFMVKDAEALDDYTVKINLKYSYGTFLSSMNYMYIVNEKTMEEMGAEAAKHPIGTGAYKFKQWDVAQQIVLEANEDYFQGAAPIKKLTFKIITDANTAYVAMEAGEADFYFNSNPLDFEDAKNNSKLGTDECISNMYYFVGFNTEKLDKKVRQALCYAVDMDQLNILVLEGTGKVVNQPMLEGQEGYVADLPSYGKDVEKAKALLAEAGYGNGLDIDFFYGENTMNSKLGQALQSMFAEIGVNLELKPVETGTWWQLFGDGDYNVSRGGYPMEDANTDIPYFDMYHKTGTFNVSRIDDPKLNGLLEQARSEVDQAKRDEIYKEITKIIHEEAYALPNFYTKSTLIYNADLKNAKAVNTQKYVYRNYSWQ